jgi:hypothetical protein
MARMPQGILGALGGKIGPVIASSWKGVPYLKSVHSARTKKISAKEKANRLKFKTAQEWLSPLLDFVRQGYKGYSPTVEGFIAAKSYLMKNAMNADGSINPSLMKVSFGSLPLSDNIAVTVIEDRFLQFTWDTTPVPGGSNWDQVMLLAYDVKSRIPMYTITGEFRETGSTILKTRYVMGSSCHIWLAFVAADRSRQSDSVYLGEITF